MMILARNSRHGSLLTRFEQHKAGSPPVFVEKHPPAVSNPQIH
jgi:hypothetical protein